MALKKTFTLKRPQKKSRISKSVTESQSSSTSETSTQPKVLDDLPLELIFIIFNNLETHEQCKLRRVCHFWKNSIEKMLQQKRYLKLNLLWTIASRKHKYHSWTPATSIQSVQFDSNWTEPTLEVAQKARATVQRRHFSAECTNALGRLFSGVHTLVIYFDFHEEQIVFDTFISMMECFKSLESFSLIRSETLLDKDFIPRLCATLEWLSPLTRLELYFDQDYLIYTPKRKMLMIKSLECLEHFALSSLPIVITQDDLQAILKNIGGLLKAGREIMKTKPFEVNTLCIPAFDTSHLPEKNLNMAKVFGSNAELRNVKRLQLTHLNSFDQVKQSLEHCHKLESLQLFHRYVADIDTNLLIKLLNQCEHLTELKIFTRKLNLLQPTGPPARHIRNLTLAANDLFFSLLYFSKQFADQAAVGGKRRNVTYQTRCSKALLRFITLKFPYLEELNLLTHCSRKNLLKMQTIVENKLKDNKNLTVRINFEYFHN